jgi:hypothetical protein
LALREKTTPGELDPSILIRTLAEHRHLIAFFNDTEAKDLELDWIPAIQFLATRGFFQSYEARPHDPLDEETRKAWLALASRHGLGVRQSLPEGLTRAQACSLFYKADK